ncbi:hypothetical protein ACFWIB_03010 [Streptomyces sp. NPDC127051]
MTSPSPACSTGPTLPPPPYTGTTATVLSPRALHTVLNGGFIVPEPGDIG